MDLLALDFDGVIADSARESFAVSLATLLEQCPGSALADADRREVERRFVQAMPLGNRAEDYGAVLRAIEAGAPLAEQADYDRARAVLDPQWLVAYHERFYRVRRRMAEEDPAGWRALMPPYARLLDLLRRRAGEVPYAIATAKDAASVADLLADYGVADLFPAERVIDKEAGASKTAHLRRLAERCSVALASITFVDDKVNHLDDVAPLGVRPVLAAWGYNGPREHRLAARRGYVVCGLDEAERLLFGTG